jgi:N-acetylneuraminate epimerase
MPRWMMWVLVMQCILGAVLGASQVESADAWTQKPSLPDREGFASPFAGTSHGALIVAGGANFPDARPWEGGKKVYYDRIYLLDPTNDTSGRESIPSSPKAWKEVGRLPRPTAYGVSVSWRDRVLCVGGNDHERLLDEAFAIEWRHGSLEVTPLPSLPVPLTNACSGLLGDTWVVCGGVERHAENSATANVWTLDLTGPGLRWERGDPLPGPGRMLAMSAVADGSFWVIGGVELRAERAHLEGASDEKQPRLMRHYLKDVYRWHPDQGWSRIADLPHPLAAAPSPCPSDERSIYVLGGDDGSQIAQSPQDHQGFSRDLLRWDLVDRQWGRAGTIPEPRVTVPCVLWGDGWVVPSGERRPGVRSPEVWQLVLP